MEFLLHLNFSVARTGRRTERNILQNFLGSYDTTGPRQKVKRGEGGWRRKGEGEEPGRRGGQAHVEREGGGERVL